MIHNKTLTDIISILFLTFLMVLLTVRNVFSAVPIIFLIISLGFIATQYKQIKVDSKVKLYLYACLIFFVINLINLIFHQDMISKGLTTVVVCLLFIPILIMFLNTTLNIQYFMGSLLIAACVYGVYAFYDRFYLHTSRAFSNIINPIPAGSIVVYVGIAALFIAVYCLNKGNRKWCFIACCCGLLSLMAGILTASRGTWLSAPLLLLLVIHNIDNIKMKRIFSVSALVVFISIVCIPQFNIVDRVHTAYTEVKVYPVEKDTSVGVRLDFWNNALSAIAEHPLMGYGVTGAAQKRVEQVESGSLVESSLGHSHLHNLYLDMLMVRGGLGLLSFLAVLLIPLYIFSSFYKQNKTSDQIKLISSLGIALIVHMMICILTDRQLAIKEVSTFYFMLIAFLIGFLYQVNAKDNTKTINADI